MEEINWTAVASTNWSASATKEGKQAEFLLQERFPWALVERIGVLHGAVATQVAAALPANGYRPTVQITANWYY